MMTSITLCAPFVNIFFTDIVGLSIKFFCVSLRHMSIRGRLVSLRRLLRGA